MKNILLLSLVLSYSSSILSSDAPPAARKFFFSDEDVANLKKMVAEKGSLAFVEALKKGQLPQGILTLPLQYIIVTDQGNETTIAEIIGRLNAQDSREKAIMDAYFSSEEGKRYLEGKMGNIGLADTAHLIHDYPFVIEYVNPFNVYRDLNSLGYYVEMGLHEGNGHARVIKDAYGALWETYRTEASISEIQLLDDHAQLRDLIKRVQEVYKKVGIKGLIRALLRKEFPSAIYKANFAEIMVSAAGNEVALGTLLKDQIKQGDKEAQKVYSLYVMRGGETSCKEVMLYAKISKDFASVADEVSCCPATARYLFDPSIALGEVIEELSEAGDEHAKKIKDAVTPKRWQYYKKYYGAAQHILSCIQKNNLDEEGIAILRDNSETVRPYVVALKKELPKQIEIGLAGVDLVMIEELEAWLRGLDKAGFAFAGPTSITEYQAQLKKRKEELAVLLLHGISDGESQDASSSDKKNSGQMKGRSAKTEKVTPWLTPSKAFLIGSGCVMAYFMIELLRGALLIKKLRENRGHCLPNLMRAKELTHYHAMYIVRICNILK